MSVLPASADLEVTYGASKKYKTALEKSMSPLDYLTMAVVEEISRINGCHSVLPFFSIPTFLHVDLHRRCVKQSQS